MFKLNARESFLMLTSCFLLLPPTLATAKDREIDLYIVAGQSNAVGADADPRKLPVDENDAKVLLWWKCGDPPADEHDSSSRQSWVSLRPQGLGNPIRPKNYETRQYGNFSFSVGGFGPEIGFGRRLITRGFDENSPTPAIAILKVAYSGTSVEDDWNPSLVDQPGNCLGELIDQYELATNKARSMGWTLRPKALLWIQGESDSVPERVDAYASRLTSTISAIRQAVGHEELAVRLAVNTKFKKAPPHSMTPIVESQKRVANALNDCQYVDTSSASVANNVHFDAAGTLMVGELLADSLIEPSKEKVSN